MLNSFFNYFKSEEAIVEPAVVTYSARAPKFGRGDEPGFYEFSFGSRNLEANTVSVGFGDCEQQVISCERNVEQQLNFENPVPGCPSSMMVRCGSGGIIRLTPKEIKLDAEFKMLSDTHQTLSLKHEALKVDANKSFIQQGLEWLDVANFFDYNQDGNVSFDDMQEAACDHPCVTFALAVVAVPAAYITGKALLGAGKGVIDGLSDIASIPGKFLPISGSNNVKEVTDSSDSAAKNKI